MIDIQQIREHTANSSIIEFAEFVIAGSDGKEFADYRKLDLMKISGLISHTFTFDYRNGIEDGLLLHHTGTFLDKFFGKNLTGKYVEDFYEVSEDAERLLELYRNGYNNKKTAFACREVDFNFEFKKFRHAESIVFQCSSSGETLNYGLGIALYFESNQNQTGSCRNGDSCSGGYRLLG